MPEVTACRLVKRVLALIAASTSVVASALAVAPTSALAAATNVSVLPNLQPYALGARASATVSLRFYGGVEHVPAPLRGAVLRLPAGLRVELSGVASCPPSRLRSRGAAGCPASALVGLGTATLEVHAGSQTLPESAAISVFRGPDQGSDPTFEIVGHGESPLDETTISSAVLLSDRPPYGSKLVISVPPIPTLTYEPNASFGALSLTIGDTSRARDPIAIPRRCPSGGFAFAASFSFADHSSTGESGRLPCP